MKRFKSRKGFTLIELVVTIAVLSIVATMGIGIVASAIRNYGTASITEQEQTRAIQLEKQITDVAKIAKGIKFADGTMPTDDGYYVFHKAGENKITPYNMKSGSKENDFETAGVKSVIVTLRRQKVNATVDADAQKTFIYMDYDIKMEEGYEIKGSVIMNNIDPTDASIVTSGTSTLIDERASFSLCPSSNDSAIVFAK